MCSYPLNISNVHFKCPVHTTFRQPGASPIYRCNVFAARRGQKPHAKKTASIDSFGQALQSEPRGSSRLDRTGRWQHRQRHAHSNFSHPPSRAWSPWPGTVAKYCRE